MTDVLVIGGGVAGLAAAITLRQQGRTVVVVNRDIVNSKIRAGESLTSSALAALKELGVADSFLANRHLPCYGNCSCWGNNQLAFFDFIQSPLGQGWYIDRSKFELMLFDKALSMDVQFTSAARLPKLERKEGAWQYDNGNETIAGKILVDASGRNSWLCRQLGVNRDTEDKQVAAMMLMPGNSINNAHSLIEAVEDGWWYVAVAGNNEICIYFTDPDLHLQADLDDPAYLFLKKDKTRFVKHRVLGQQQSLLQAPQLTGAGSSMLSQFAGEGWLATGDAACAMDPLSSHGLTFALRSGIDAGWAAAGALGESVLSLTEYEEKLSLAASVYQQKRIEVYRQETRWPGSPYWKRRH